MNLGFEEGHVWLLFDKKKAVQGVYASEGDAVADADFLGNGHYAQCWAIDFFTVAHP